MGFGRGRGTDVSILRRSVAALGAAAIAAAAAVLLSAAPAAASGGTLTGTWLGSRSLSATGASTR